MAGMWLNKRTILTVLAAMALPAGAAHAGQRPEVQRLFQAGAYQETVEAASGADPASTYLAAQALIKMEKVADATSTLRQLSSGDGAWPLVGESGEALLGGNGARALELARKAVDADPDNSWAFYQLGLAASKQADFAQAVSAFTRSIELNGDFAYGHYYAALANQRVRQIGKSAEHFTAFLRLAPDAPERQAVMAIMRTLK